MERKEPALISLLARLFIKPDPAREEPETRRAYGVLCGIVGICLNVLLFAGKFLAGTLSGSIAITADAFNNLSDAGSSFVTLVGFQLAGQKPDSEHPFGHGRMEYVSGLAVSVLILLMGLELGKTSIEKILHPEPVDSSPLIFAILCASILVKLYMFLYNRRLGKKLASPAMEATAMDSLSDSVATAAVLIATGSEVATLVEGAELLAAEGIPVRVVNVPSEGLFRDQPRSYQESVLPAGVARYGMTSGLPVNLRGLVGENGVIHGLDHFGWSAPYKVLDEKFGYNGATVAAEVKKMLGK